MGLSQTHACGTCLEKPVFGVSDQVRLIQTCLATETTQNIEIFHAASVGNMLNTRKQIKKVLIRLRIAGWSVTTMSGFLASSPVLIRGVVVLHFEPTCNYSCDIITLRAELIGLVT